MGKLRFLKQVHLGFVIAWGSIQQLKWVVDGLLLDEMTQSNLQWSSLKTTMAALASGTSSSSRAMEKTNEQYPHDEQ